MPRRFGEYPLHGEDYPTTEESYADGYETGKSWHHNHVPGGPWVRGISAADRSLKDADWIAYSDATAENNSEWMRGWRDAAEEFGTYPKK